jgi:hypothetical protein
MVRERVGRAWPGVSRWPASAETFRVFKLGAIREDVQSPWVPFPTDAAVASYEEMKLRYRRQSVFATEG